MNIEAVVILYNPTQETVNNILTYSSFVKFVYVFDNSETQNKQVINQINEIKNCIVLHDSKNEGIAKRLNEAVKIASIKRMDWLLTMDQDSSFSKESITSYLSCLIQLKEKGFKDNNIALIGAQYLSPELQSKEINLEYKNRLITSGTIINLNVSSLIGEFNEDLFIDQVDTEYSYRANILEYNVLCLNNIYFKHQLGTSKKIGKKNRTLHNSTRIYYMTRNYLYLNSKYKQYFKDELNQDKVVLLNSIKNNLLYSSEKFSTIKYFIKGIIDFKKGRMGKLN